MRLSPETLARERPQRYPMAIEQPELPNFPPPMTVNRAKDFNHLSNGCNSCGTRCDYCVGWDFKPLER